MKMKLTALALTAGGLSMLSAGAALAAPGGYGPAAGTGPAGTPGGYTTVVTTQTVGPSGGSITAAVAGANVSVSVPPGAFQTPVQVELTKPDLSAITPAALSASGFSSYTAVAGLGVKVLDTSGTPLGGSFAKPLDVTLTGPGLGMAGEKVLMLTGPSSASVIGSSLGANSITVHLTEDPNLTVVNPVTAAGSGGSVIPGATQQPTGKPFHGEEVAAGLLILAGLGSFSVSRRRSRISAPVE